MKKRIFPTLMAILMVFAMMPMTSGTVFADDGTVYTVNVEPGESGDIMGITVMSNTILSEEDMWAGNYTQTAGCFYLGNNGKLYYKLPSRCSFTAPEGKEFDCWEASFGGTFSCGTSIDMAGKGNFTITALWKEPDPDPYLTLSIPESININYGDEKTAFDIQIKEVFLSDEGDNFEVQFGKSSFQSTSHDGTIPFTVSTNAEGTTHGYHGDKCYIAIFSFTPLPFNCQGYIEITSDDWAAAEPGTYTATLKTWVVDIDGLCEAQYSEIPLTLVVPDPATVHSVTVNNGTGSGSYVEGESVTITANAPETGKQFKEWTGTDGLTFTKGSKSSSTAKFTMPANDVSVTATYEEIPASPTELFTVTFVDGQGNTLKSETVEKGQAAKAPADPTREGFTFNGWDTDFSNVTSDLTVTAKWKENATPSEPTKIAVPTGKTLTYNGKSQTGVSVGTGYVLSGTTSATNAGSYKATATLDEGYAWSDGTSDPKTISWTINKAMVNVTAPAGKTFTYNGKEQTGVAAGSNYTLSGTAKATNAGSYTAKATLKTNANYTYKWSDGTTAAKTVNWKINKAANPLTIKAKTAAVKYAKVKKKAQTLAATKVITFTKKGQGKMTYTLVYAKKGSKSFKKKFAINKTTGKVTIKKNKKMKKGTYKVKVKVKASGDRNYNESSVKTVTFKIKIK